MEQGDAKEALKVQVKKLNQQATALKLDLHDLAEDLPTGWEKIPALAEKTYNAHAALKLARQALAATSG
jgi:hypothetical protein